MVVFKELIDKAIKEGYSDEKANAKVAQDVILLIISKIEYNKNVTLKGGVLMRSFSNDARRATKDLDIDLIRYSIDDSSLEKLINKFDGIEGIEVKINGKIKELNQQDYKGKRVSLMLKDSNNKILTTKIDFGVHVDLSIAQTDYCIDVGLSDDRVVVLANTMEQVFVEKLCSLLRHRIATTRYKDIFDMYYLIEYMDMKKLQSIVNKLILDNENYSENTISDVVNSLQSIFSNEGFVELVRTSRDNWINKDVKEVLDGIVLFVKNI